MVENQFQALKGVLELAEDDAAKFYGNGNKAAGTRLRKHMQDIKNIAQGVRLEIQEIKNKED